MPLPLRVFIMGLFISTPCTFAASLPRSSPEAQGVSSAELLSFVQAADATIDTMHSFMLVRHGFVVAEGWWTPYDAATPHELYSLSKSFTSTAVGMAVAEGKMSIDDPILKFFPEDASEKPSANLKAMRVRDLLAMSTGHHTEDLAKFSFETNEVLTKAFLALPVAHKPGTHFLYNTPATYMLSAIVQKVSGQTVLDYLQPRLFQPLGIENPTWRTSPQGISLGGYGLSVRTEDIAKFGQLYLQGGEWHGKPLLPATWVEAASARQTSNGSDPESDWDQGYGYQFWRCRHGAFRGDGAFGQYCIVMPEQDAVLAITSGVRSMQAVLNLVWDKLLPGLEPEALPADAKRESELKAALASLKVRPQSGADAPKTDRAISGTKYSFASNGQKVEAVWLDLASGSRPSVLHLRRAGKDLEIACGNNSWTHGRFAIGRLEEQPAAASGGWTAEDTFTAKVCFVETPFYHTITLRFADDQLFFNDQANVGFGQTGQPQLAGRAE